jgi:peroxiredoxin
MSGVRAPFRSALSRVIAAACASVLLSVPFAHAATSAPGLELEDLAGRTVKLSSFRGKTPVLLVFWTTWCPYCTKQIPNINQLEDAFGPDELAVLAVNSGEGRTKVAGHVQKTGMRYRVLLDKDDRAIEAYGVTGFPYMVLISREGNIAGVDYGVTSRLVDKIRLLTGQGS